jgi:hypothetical protein
MSINTEQMLEAEYKQLREKLQAGIIKSPEFERLIELQEQFIYLYKYTSDELFMIEYK